MSLPKKARKTMAKCIDCAYCEPCGSKWACFNLKCQDGNFIRFVKPDDDYDSAWKCFEKASEYDMSLKKEYMKGITEGEG